MTKIEKTPMPDGFHDRAAWDSIHWEFAGAPTFLDSCVIAWQLANQDRVRAAIVARTKEQMRESGLDVLTSALEKLRNWDKREPEYLTAKEISALLGRWDELVTHMKGANAAFIKIIELSGADLSGGMPTDRTIDVFAIECVEQLRKDYDEA